MTAIIVIVYRFGTIEDSFLFTGEDETNVKNWAESEYANQAEKYGAKQKEIQESLDDDYIELQDTQVFITWPKLEQLP